MGDDIALHPHRLDQVPEHARPTPSTSRSSTSTPRCGWRATASATSRGWSSGSGSQKARRVHGAVRRDRRLLDGASGAGRRARSCCSTPTAATRAARMQLRRAARSAEGVRRHDLCDWRASSTSRPSRGRSSGSVLQQIAEATGGQAFFPHVGQRARGDLRAGRGRDPRAVHARLPLDQRPDRRRLAQGRDQGPDAPDREDLRVRTRKGYFAPYSPEPRNGQLEP